MIIQIEPWIGEEELVQLKRVVDSTYVTEAALTKEFEQLTKDMTKSKHVLTACNGTMALYMALKALNIGPGDEVIVPNLTFIATANSVIMAGATPIFCDVRRDNFCIDTKLASKLVTKNTKAIIPVHLYGQTPDMNEIMGFAREFNLKVIEDAAQGVGVFFENKHAGTFGDIGILSYYGNKTITTGEGGVLLTNDDDLAKALYRLKNHGRDQKGIFVHEHIGFNFSFTEMQAAIGIAQMHKLERIVKKKQEIKDKYYEELKDVKEITLPYIDPRCTPVFWFTSILVKGGSDKLAAHLKEKGIQTRRFFYPLHKQPCYQPIPEISKQFSTDSFSVSSELYEEGLSLPSAFALAEGDQDLVIQSIRGFYGYRG